MDEDDLFGQLWDVTERVEYDDLDHDTIDTAKLRIYDSIAVGLRAIDDDRIGRLHQFAQSKSGTDQGSILGTATTGSVEYAAFANAAMIRHLDWNDSYLRAEAAHPSGNIGAILPLAEANDRSGQDAILATVLAYELQCRLCDVASFTDAGFDHVNYGLVSVPLTYAKLAGLNREQAHAAVGIAVNSHIALLQARQAPLSEWKGYAFANAVRNGIVAGELGREGVHGPSHIFTGTQGLHTVLNGTLDGTTLGLGDDGFAINETHLKRYPICHHILAGIDAAMEIRSMDTFDPADIQSIDVHTYDIAIRVAGGEDKWRPTTRGTADHSIPYCLARALLDGPIEPDDLDGSALHENHVIELMDRIEVHPNEAFSDAYGESFPHRVVVDTHQDTVESTVEYPAGHYRNPLEWEEVTTKLTGSDRIASDAAEQLRAAVENLDTSDDIADLIAAAERIGSAVA